MVRLRHDICGKSCGPVCPDLYYHCVGFEIRRRLHLNRINLDAMTTMLFFSSEVGNHYLFRKINRR